MEKKKVILFLFISICLVSCNEKPKEPEKPSIIQGVVAPQRVHLIIETTYIKGFPTNHYQDDYYPYMLHNAYIGETFIPINEHEYSIVYHFYVEKDSIIDVVRTLDSNKRAPDILKHIDVIEEYE